MDWGERLNKKRKGVFDNIINTDYKDVCPRCGGKKNMFGIQKFEGGIFTCKWVDYNFFKYLQNNKINSIIQV